MVDSNWIEEDYTLEPGSIVAYSGEQIIACIPAPLIKSSHNIGSCYSHHKKWRVAISWRTVRPNVCNDHLVAVEDQALQITAYQFDINNGELLNQKILPSLQDNLCEIFIQ